MSMTEVLRLADAYADASFEQGLNQRTKDPAPEKAREALANEVDRMRNQFAQMAEALERIAGYSLSQFKNPADMAAQCVDDAAKASAAATQT